MVKEFRDQSGASEMISLLKNCGLHKARMFVGCYFVFCSLFALLFVLFIFDYVYFWLFLFIFCVVVCCLFIFCVAVCCCFFFFALLFVVVMQENNNTVKVKIVKALLQRTSVGREFTLSSQQKVTSRSLVSSLEH